MEVKIEVKEDEINEDFSRGSDGIFRDLLKRFPNGIWEKNGNGYKILI